MSNDLRTAWEHEGYLVVRRLFSPERTTQLRTICDGILTQWRQENPETGKPGGASNATVMRHLNHSGYFHAHPEWKRAIMEAIADPQVLTVARTILGEDPLFRCTSLFFDPLEGGKDGNWHRDSQFGTPDDTKEQEIIAKLSSSGGGIQMQIALVPSDDVEYVPGSHLRWDSPAEYAIRKADGGTHSRSNEMPGALRLALDPGDAALFNPYGLHRGRYHTGRPRRTLMLTYTKSSAPHSDYFSNQPWFLEPGYLDDLEPATHAFFEPFVAEYEGFWAEQQRQAATM